MQHEHKRFIPSGAQKVSDKHSDAVAYIYGTEQAPCAMIFFGKGFKPVANFRYRNSAAREASIKDYFGRKQAHDKRLIGNAAERKAEIATVKFQVGQTYYDRSACDYDAIYTFKIVARTEKTLTIEEYGKTKKRGIYIYKGVEQCKPHGTYSMCSIIRADNHRTP